jgi:SnoaL-like domain
MTFLRQGLQKQSGVANCGLVSDMSESRPDAELLLNVSAAFGHPDLRRAVYELFSRIDAMDVAAVVGMFTDDGAVRFANQERVVGRPGVQQVVETLFSGIRALDHRHVVRQLGGG